MDVALMLGLTALVLGMLVQTFAQVLKKDINAGWILIVLGGLVALSAGLWLGWARVLSGPIA